jgi:hypothetical protein
VYASMQVSTDGICRMFLYLFLVRLGFRTAPIFSIITGEIALSTILGYVIIIPSPLGLEAVEFPTRILVKTLIKTDGQLKIS